MQPPNGQPTCAGIREAREWISTANERLVQGGRFDPARAGQMVEQAQQFLEYADRTIAQLRCTS
jgi:hypothetical protein